MVRNFIIVSVISLIIASCALFGAKSGTSNALESRVIEAPRDRVFAALADEENLIGFSKVTDTGSLAVYELPMNESDEETNAVDTGSSNSQAMKNANLLTIRLTRPKRVEIILTGDKPSDKRTISADLNPIKDGKFTSIEFNGNIGEAEADGGSNAELTSEGKKFVNEWLDRAEKEVKKG